MLRRCIQDQPRCVSLAYLIFGLLWIYGTDALIENFSAPMWAKVSLFKGSLFVVFTAIVLFRVLRSRLAAVRELVGSHYDYVIKYANDIFILIEIDEPRPIVEVNDRACAAYGYTREEMIGMPSRLLRISSLREKAGRDMDSFYFRHLLPT